MTLFVECSPASLWVTHTLSLADSVGVRSGSPKRGHKEVYLRYNMPTQTVPKRQLLSRTFCLLGNKTVVKSRITKGQAQTHACSLCRSRQQPKDRQDLNSGLVYKNAAIQNLSNLISPGPKITAVLRNFGFREPLEDKEIEPKLLKKLTRNVQPLQAGNPWHAKCWAGGSRSGTLYWRYGLQE